MLKKIRIPIHKIMTMIEFETIDIEGEICNFQYISETSDDGEYVFFKIYSIPKDEMRWFTYKVQLVNNTLAKSENMTCNGNGEFLKKGIPEKIIPIASIYLNRSIISSPLNSELGNFLIDNSVKVWDRLVAQNQNAVRQENNFIYNLE